MKIFKGITKKVPSEEHFKQFNDGTLDLAKLSLIDTIQVVTTSEGSEFQSLPIRLSYQEIDRNGNEKYIYDADAGVYTKSYKQTPILHARAKEMRILIELGEFCPVKVVCEEVLREDKVYYVIVCVQNQHMGLE